MTYDPAEAPEPPDPAEGLADSLRDVADVMELAESNPRAAARTFREWAAELIAAAEVLEAQPPGDTVSEGGFGDRVRARVIGPDGSLRGTGGTAN